MTTERSDASPHDTISHLRRRVEARHEECVQKVNELEIEGDRYLQGSYGELSAFCNDVLLLIDAQGPVIERLAGCVDFYAADALLAALRAHVDAICGEEE